MVDAAGCVCEPLPSTRAASALVTAFDAGAVPFENSRALKVTPGNSCAGSDGLLTATLQYWIASCATPTWFADEKLSSVGIGRQLLLHGQVGLRRPPVGGRHARERRQRRVDLREGAHADVGHHRREVAGAIAIGTGLDDHVGLGAQLIEAQEELVGQRAALQAR